VRPNFLLLYNTRGRTNFLSGRVKLIVTGWKYLASQNDSFTPGKVYRCEVINTSFVRLRFSRRFVLIRVGTFLESRDVAEKLSQHVYDLRFSRRFVLVRVAYLSRSEAYTYNSDVFGTEDYLAFDWWKHVGKVVKSVQSIKTPVRTRSYFQVCGVWKGDFIQKKT
jgi:hypothetical protein